jgi:hypothetical protein
MTTPQASCDGSTAIRTTIHIATTPSINDHQPLAQPTTTTTTSITATTTTTTSTTLCRNGTA